MKKKDLLQKDYNYIFNLYLENRYPNSIDLIEEYIETLNSLDKKFYLLDLLEYIRLEYKNFESLYSLEEINYLLLELSMECADIDKFQYYKDNFEKLSDYQYTKSLYINFFSEKNIEEIGNNLLENKSIDLFIILSRLYIIKKEYKLAYNNYINTLQKAFILNDNYYIDIIYSDLLKYYKYFNIDDELYFEILEETKNSDNIIFSYFIGLNHFYNFDLEKSSKEFNKLLSYEINKNLDLDFLKYKAQCISKIIKYLQSNNEKTYNEIIRLIFSTFSYYEIKIILETLFKKRNSLFLHILEEYLSHNFNLKDIEVFDIDHSLFYKPKLLISDKFLLKIKKELDTFNKKANIYFEGIGLYGEFFYIISYLSFKNININVYFNTKEDKIPSTEYLKYIKSFSFTSKINFFQDEKVNKIDFAFINSDLIDNFDKNKFINIDTLSLYSSSK